MMGLNELRKDHELINMIDWEMTPEEAVTLYLEWGNNWSHGRKMIKSKKDVSIYFVINTWENPPVVYLVRRNSEEAVEIATIEMPEKLRERFLGHVGHNKGVYAPNESVRNWLAGEIFGDDSHHVLNQGMSTVN
ncbi:MAG: DVU0772 family protein [Pseudomonadota bacterium]